MIKTTQLIPNDKNSCMLILNSKTKVSVQNKTFLEVPVKKKGQIGDLVPPFCRGNSRA